MIITIITTMIITIITTMVITIIITMVITIGITVIITIITTMVITIGITVIIAGSFPEKYVPLFPWYLRDQGDLVSSSGIGITVVIQWVTLLAKSP